ncbi:uncharacterized protein LOC129731126 [Wyeomyia smithii]|uniref:uncharacterized protein LOC129731126 n=1 Tax=Wyeomyia smithii TaxID=174621 RepID=UPI0024681943|nr:uncharacterized protein LOC129731126 [Wyeomyia smithii]
MDPHLDSSSEEEGYLSPYCCSSDEENECLNRKLVDELPAFSTQSLSPSGRSLSPIDMNTSPPRSKHSTPCSTPVDSSGLQQQPPSVEKDYVTLEEVHARIGLTPPPDVRTRNLETIFEDKFLETPPSREFESRTNRNLLRHSFRNRGLMADGNCTTEKVPSSQSSVRGTNNKQFDGKRRLSLD